MIMKYKFGKQLLYKRLFCMCYLLVRSTSNFFLLLIVINIISLFYYINKTKFLKTIWIKLKSEQVLLCTYGDIKLFMKLNIHFMQFVNIQLELGFLAKFIITVILL